MVPSTKENLRELVRPKAWIPEALTVWPVLKWLAEHLWRFIGDWETAQWLYEQLPKWPKQIGGSVRHADAFVSLVGIVWLTVLISAPRWKHGRTTLALELRSDDPRIYPQEIKETAYGSTFLVLQNIGGGMAYKVHVEPINFTLRNVVFYSPEIMPAKETREVVTSAIGKDVNWKNRGDFFNWAMEDWDVASKTKTLAEEMVYAGRITYINFVNRERFIETVFDLVIFPTRLQNHRQRRMNQPQPPEFTKFYEFRNVVIKRSGSSS